MNPSVFPLEIQNMRFSSHSSEDCPCRGLSSGCPFCEGTGFWLNRKKGTPRSQRKKKSKTTRTVRVLDSFSDEYKREVRDAISDCANFNLLPNRVRVAALDSNYDAQILIDMLHDESEAGNPPSKPADFFLSFARSTDAT